LNENINNKIRAVIFDLGRVLVNVDLTKSIFRQSSKYKNMTDKQIMETLFKKPSVYTDLAEGRISGQKFYEKMCGQLGLDLSYEEFVEKWCSIFEPMAGMDKLVSELSEKYKLGLLSDIGPIHWNYLINEMAVLKAFKKPVLSYKTGILKPDAEAYRIAAKSVGCRMNECLFIDDRAINVQGAEKAGMAALQFESAAKLKMDLKKIGLV